MPDDDILNPEEQKTEVEALDRILSAIELPSPSDVLRNRVIRDAVTYLEGRAPGRKAAAGTFGWQSFGALAACLIAGILIGIYLMPTDNPDLIELEVSQTILG